MNYEQIENDIIAKLNSQSELISMADCMSLPDSLSEYKPPYKKGLVTAVFVGEKFDQNQSIGDVSQHYTLSFNLSIQSRLLRGDKGLYVIANLVKDTLVGFQPSDCGPFSLTEHSFAGYENDVWEHSIVFSCRTLRTQIYPYYTPDNDITAGELVYFDPNKITINETIQVPGQV